MVWQRVLPERNLTCYVVVENTTLSTCFHDEGVFTLLFLHGHTINSSIFCYYHFR